MKIIIVLLISAICLIFLCCSEDSTDTPPIDQNTKGKLAVFSDPTGAQIFLRGTNTGKVTPDSITNLDPGIYDGYLYLQYYDTTFFSAEIFANTTTFVDTTLDDALPFVEFVFDYQISFGSDSVRFSFVINQDVTMDSIVVQRPVDLSGTTVTDKYVYSAQLFEYQDISGNPIKYYLPPAQSGMQYYPAVDNRFYYFSMFGHKAYGSKAEFRSYYQVMF